MKKQYNVPVTKFINLEPRHTMMQICSNNTGQGGGYAIGDDYGEEEEG